MTEIDSRRSRLVNRILHLGGELPHPDLAPQKVVLVALSLSAVPLTLIWAPIEFTFTSPRSGVITGAIGLVILLNFLAYLLHRHYLFFRLSQLVIFITFPVVLHVTNGGFTQSANIVWSLATPLIALVGSSPREGTPWLVAFLAIVAALGFLDPTLFPESSLSPGDAFIQFSFNIINGALIVYLVLLYFLRQKNRAYQLLHEEEARSEQLLLNVLPKEVAEDLMSGEQAIADRFDAATILFADVVGFTPLSTRLAPEAMVELLNEIFSHFDNLAERYHLEKIRTIGDSYMVASGVPKPRNDHAHCIALLALDIRDYIQSFPSQDGAKIDFRIGINSGSVVGGIIGKKRFHYDLWGDPVNVASRMESQGVPGRIQVTGATRALLEDRFRFESRGVIPVKGRGQMETFFLMGPK